MRKMLMLSTVVVTASLVLAVAAFGRPSATTVGVTAGKPSELRFTLSKRTIAKGATTFRVTNRGALTHDFRIAGKKTPLLRPGKASSFTVTFRRAGRYTFLCTVPGHAAGGMKGTLTVR